MENEATIRLSIFLGSFLVLALLEIVIPMRREAHDRPQRWFANLGLSIVSTLVLRFVLPVAAVASAYWANLNGIGLFNWLDVSPLIAGVIAFFILDFAVWLEHLVSHKWQWLWNLHKVHHSDRRLDVSSAIRFHPLEICVSMLWKAALVVALGAPVLSVVIFEIVLNAASLFNHANIKIPRAMDRILRLVIVTPDMHRIHHSDEKIETNSNYGFNFPFWDRLFGTYTEDPALGQEKMVIGLKQYPGGETKKLLWLLVLPFKALGVSRRNREGNNADKAR
ncbi:sterol desaturase family protein [Rhodobacteraceae bacterium RKSG542]|nr:sterol desaturase family protein [Pseudovibrio flavus]MTI18770.1 sterol desaturase family protein [Pseudovibrio flavus]